jgi:hypothetical protein
MKLHRFAQVPRRLILSLVFGLAGCAGVLETAPPGSAMPHRPSVLQALAEQAEQREAAAFEARQRALADLAETRGQWAQAAWAWEALLALRPADATLTARLQRAQQAAASLSTLRVQQSRLALQLNDADSAQGLLLKALLAQPTNAEAIDGLRALERTRVRSQMQAEPSPMALPSSPTPPVRAELEHASLLAAQHDLDGAIGLLLPLASGRLPNPSARRDLSTLYLRQAALLRSSEPAKAMTLLQRSLQMDGSNTQAAALLRAWRQAAATRTRVTP